jgi:hypothetical protein
MFDAIFGRSRIPRVHHQSMVPRAYLVVAVISALILLALLVKVWFFPSEDEKDPYVIQIREMEQAIERQERLIGVLKKENRELQQRYTKMEHLRGIDQESLSNLYDQLKADQNERLKVEKELAFRKGMVSSDPEKVVLQLQKLRLQPGKEENSFQYAFTVNRALKGTEYLEGFAYLTLTGEQEGKKRSIPFKQVNVDKKDKIKLRFKHFQSIEGEMQLPSGFKPSGVTIEVRPVNGKIKSVKKSYKWVLSN